MKKLISILTIAALAGVIAIGCSQPEDQGKPGDTTGGTTTTGGAPKVDDKSATTGGQTTGGAPKMDDKGATTGGEAPKTDEKKEGEAPKTEDKK